ncbi:DUF6089 family protein [Pontibacter sp. SGAir0037]|uniref:type IX secretion system protein PorG n=1 Tax=Pontibacter sp. SGAir0037 TaxID=2571030 RepID=UPI0010CCB9CE|nr:DUF6089 family protein [Pontibacter sp. SGAir0037]QCR24295.1 hypothetical protein C1N53_19325 [Pontibacter sp. SGAir0037]
MTIFSFRLALTACFLFLLINIFFSEPAVAQKPLATSEIGVGLGGLNYQGDLAPHYRFLSNQPALTVFYRHDLSHPITLRGAIMGSHRILNNNTMGDDDFDLPLPNFRQANMRLTVGEISGVVEYNFLDYYDLTQKVRFSPYLFAGVAGFVYNIRTEFGDEVYAAAFNQGARTSLGVAIPFGVGVKYALNKYWNLGLEFGARKLFTDRLDNIHMENSQGQDKRVANPYDKDWYFYNGISLSYTIYRINCPPTYKANPGILD